MAEPEQPLANQPLEVPQPAHNPAAQAVADLITMRVEEAASMTGDAARQAAEDAKEHLKALLNPALMRYHGDAVPRGIKLANSALHHHPDSPGGVLAGPEPNRPDRPLGPLPVHPPEPDVQRPGRVRLTADLDGRQRRCQS